MGAQELACAVVQLFIHNSIFSNNKTLDTCESFITPGGAINVGDAVLRITNSRFEGNESAGHGAAVWIIGSWNEPERRMRLLPIQHSLTTKSNAAIQIQDQSKAAQSSSRIILTLGFFNSSFIKNSASLGSASSILRSKIEIYKSTFLGNRATDTIPSSGSGGAISFNPNNRTVCQLVDRISYFQGRYDGITTVAQGGGGIATSDSTTYPYSGLSIKRVVLNDLDVTTHSGRENLALVVLSGLEKWIYFLKIQLL